VHSPGEIHFCRPILSIVKMDTGGPTPSGCAAIYNGASNTPLSHHSVEPLQLCSTSILATPPNRSRREAQSIREFSQLPYQRGRNARLFVFESRGQQVRMLTTVCDVEHGGLGPFSYINSTASKKPPEPRDACGERRNASSHQASSRCPYFWATKIPHVRTRIRDTLRRNSLSDTLLTAGLPSFLPLQPECP
jgi:hypothetical protein